MFTPFFYSNGTEDQSESTEQQEPPPKRRGRPPRNPQVEVNEKEMERYYSIFRLTYNLIER